MEEYPIRVLEVSTVVRCFAINTHTPAFCFKFDLRRAGGTSDPNARTSATREASMCQHRGGHTAGATCDLSLCWTSLWTFLDGTHGRLPLRCGYGSPLSYAEAVHRNRTSRRRERSAVPNKHGNQHELAGVTHRQPRTCASSERGPGAPN